MANFFNSLESSKLDSLESELKVMDFFREAQNFFVSYRPHRRILGGQLAREEQFPYQVREKLFIL